MDGNVRWLALEFAKIHNYSVDFDQVSLINAAIYYSQDKFRQTLLHLISLSYIKHIEDCVGHFLKHKSTPEIMCDANAIRNFKVYHNLVIESYENNDSLKGSTKLRIRKVHIALLDLLSVHNIDTGLEYISSFVGTGVEFPLHSVLRNVLYTNNPIGLINRIDNMTPSINFVDKVPWVNRLLWQYNNDATQHVIRSQMYIDCVERYIDQCTEFFHILDLDCYRRLKCVPNFVKNKISNHKGWKVCHNVSASLNDFDDIDLVNIKDTELNYFGCLVKAQDEDYISDIDNSKESDVDVFTKLVIDSFWDNVTHDEITYTLREVLGGILEFSDLVHDAAGFNQEYYKDLSEVLKFVRIAVNRTGYIMPRDVITCESDRKYAYDMLPELEALTTGRLTKAAVSS